MVTLVNGRTLEVGQKVMVYFNLRKKCFSIQDFKTGLVVAHAPVIHLKDCTFKVSKSGRERVLRERQKNVHAKIVGTFTGTTQGLETEKACYNPYRYDSFVDSQERPLKQADSVTCINKHLLYK